MEVALKVSLSIFGNGGHSRESFPRELENFLKLVDSELIHTIWFPERHAPHLSCHHCNPLINIAFCSALDKKIHLGTGSLIPALHSPSSLFDQVQQISVLSSKRLRVSVGAGWDQQEFERYEANFESRYECLHSFTEILRQDSYFRSTENLLTTISSSVPRWEEAGTQGLGVYCGAFGKDFSTLRSLITRYRMQLVNSPNRHDSGWVACMTHFWAESSSSKEGNYSDKIKGYLKRHGSSSSLSQTNQELMVSKSIKRMTEETGLIGPPDEILNRLNKYKKAGVDELILLFEYTDSLDQETNQLLQLQDILRSI